MAVSNGSDNRSCSTMIARCPINPATGAMQITIMTSQRQGNCAIWSKLRRGSAPPTERRSQLYWRQTRRQRAGQHKKAISQRSGPALRQTSKHAQHGKGSDGRAHLKADRVVRAGHADAKAPVGAEELVKGNEVAAEVVAPAKPLIDAHVLALHKGR